MRILAARAVSAAVLVIGLAFGGQGSALAVSAGEFCANADAGTVRTADNGATVQCTFNPNSNRSQWVAIATTTTVATIPASTSTTATSLAVDGRPSSGSNSGAASNATAEPNTPLLPVANQTATTVTTTPASGTTATTVPAAAPASASSARPLALTG